VRIGLVSVIEGDGMGRGESRVLLITCCVSKMGQSAFVVDLRRA